MSEHSSQSDYPGAERGWSSSDGLSPLLTTAICATRWRIAS
jgi:hypothetical protein